jgi:hypothetical protein
MIMAPRGFGAIIHSLDFSAHRADHPLPPAGRIS